ncbi:F-box associated domain [Macleaya cordata]|uniref:F-box associated domain n=1 Tax=Macleaya cordata TaxID=56857 RepID=A0A200RAD5_MACCD|nr:F-box associated domain [Macleaya cordata]
MQKKEISFRPGNDVFLGKKIDILYSLKGLLLISSVDVITGGTVNYHVCNPITGRSTILPDLNLPVLRNCIFGSDKKRNLIFGLAYNSVMAKYKAVCCGNYNTYKHEYFCKIVTVGVEGDSWRDVIIPRPHFLPDYPPVFASGSLQWTIGRSLHQNLNGSLGTEAESKGQILSMDVSREIFYTIRRPPPPQRYSDHLSYSLLEMRGSLCCIDNVTGNQLKLWVLKDLENKQHKWMKLCSINIGHSERSLSFLGFQGCYFPFGIVTNPTTNKNSKMIIMSYDSNKEMMKMFYSYDMEQKQLDDQIVTWSPWRRFGQRWYSAGGSSALELKPWDEMIPIWNSST